MFISGNVLIIFSSTISISSGFAAPIESARQITSTSDFKRFSNNFSILGKPGFCSYAHPQTHCKPARISIFAFLALETMLII